MALVDTVLPTGPGGQGQFFAAKVPQPLAGTYSGAAGNGSMRGRGGHGASTNGHQQTLPIRNGNPNGHANGISPRGGLVHNAPRGGGGQPLHMNNGGIAGSYRGRGGGGYANGNGHAGAGGENRKGFTIVDNSDPTEGIMKHNPNFRMQNYSNVPPPSGLNAAGGGGERGRGGGGGAGSMRGRGGAGRGRGGAGPGAQ